MVVTLSLTHSRRDENAAMSMSMTSFDTCDAVRKSGRRTVSLGRLLVVYDDNTTLNSRKNTIFDISVLKR